MAEDSRVERARVYATGLRAAGHTVEAALVEGALDAYEERLRVNVGLVAQNAELRRAAVTEPSGLAVTVGLTLHFRNAAERDAWITANREGLEAAR